ncbi:hypothetical protein BRE01_08630 [Brevibacillus reuszeri]|uniref:PLAT domain-containing protein n=1 Tax=Brevibacillus reuszeri TaxID=54915 RepID=A0A0K9YS96_9BACL|nr:hypothetical protein [Brevibacillus reuszeri]KNB71507.1 hypothetical protein ADS79_22305 [Brevibacillus reuszeri]MED1855690.1 hypothetical protein [Brevibacillus reuszeri]GED67161.1 hypothetical protein BRE01_08630 [Brevibacillus reuszeri]
MLKKSSSLLIFSLALFAISSAAYAGYSTVTSTASLTFQNNVSYYKVLGKGTAKASGTGKGQYIHITATLEKNGDIEDMDIDDTTSSTFSLNVSSGKEGDPATWYVHSDSLLTSGPNLTGYVDTHSDEVTKKHPGI